MFDWLTALLMVVLPLIKILDYLDLLDLVAAAVKLFFAVAALSARLAGRLVRGVVDGLRPRHECRR